jgi:serine/threonine-protein kinase
VRPDIDPVFASAVERALDRDPSRRFQSAEDMADGLTGAAGNGAATVAAAVPFAGEETTVLATDDGVTSTLVGAGVPLPLASPPPHRAPLRMIFTVAAVLLVGVALLLALTARSHENPTSTTPSTTATTVTSTSTPTTASPATTPAATHTADSPAPAPGRHHKGGGGKKG